MSYTIICDRIIPPHPPDLRDFVFDVTFNLFLPHLLDYLLKPKSNLMILRRRKWICASQCLKSAFDSKEFYVGKNLSLTAICTYFKNFGVLHLYSSVDWMMCCYEFPMCNNDSDMLWSMLICLTDKMSQTQFASAIKGK